MCCVDQGYLEMESTIEEGMELIAPFLSDLSDDTLVDLEDETEVLQQTLVRDREPRESGREREGGRERKGGREGGKERERGSESESEIESETEKYTATDGREKQRHHGLGLALSHECRCVFVLSACV